MSVAHSDRHIEQDIAIVATPFLACNRVTPAPYAQLPTPQCLYCIAPVRRVTAAHPSASMSARIAASLWSGCWVRFSLLTPAVASLIFET